MRFLNDTDKLMLVQEEPRGPSQLVEVPVTVNGLGKIPFPDVANLRNQSDQVIIIKSMRLITPSVLTTAPITGGANAPLTELVKCSAVLYCEGWEKGQLIPLLTMNDMFTEGSGEPFRSRPMKLDSWRNLDWSKSFIQYGNGTVSAGQPYTFVFDVEYVKMRLVKDASGNVVSYEEIVGPN